MFTLLIQFWAVWAEQHAECTVFCPRPSRTKWYFVTKIVLTYCEKKLFVWKWKKFEIRGWVHIFSKKLRSQEHFIWTFSVKLLLQMCTIYELNSRLEIIHLHLNFVFLSIYGWLFYTAPPKVIVVRYNSIDYWPIPRCEILSKRTI